jgi:hypothetical protein
MLEHYFCLVEFKSLFEFICLTSFEKWQNNFFFLTLSFFASGLARAPHPTSAQ